jgi:hypothetical protein
LSGEGGLQTVFSGPLLAGVLLSCTDASLVLSEAHRYRFEAEMELETMSVASGTDSTLSWQDLTTDLQGWTVEADQVERLSLIAFGLDKDSLLEAITTNSLRQSDVADYRLIEDSQGMTSASLSDFGVLGSAFEPETEFLERADRTWLVSLWDLDREGRDEILTSVHLEPSTSSMETGVLIDDQSARFSFWPELEGLTPIRAPASRADLVADWSGLGEDAMGNAWDPVAADRLLILNLDAATLSAVEADFSGHIRDAIAVYRGDIRGETEARLSICQTPEGQAFGGFSTEGLWLLGLECSTCTSPIPLVLSVVEIED